MRIYCCALGLLTLLAAPLAGYGEESPYYPTRTGSRWEYRTPEGIVVIEVSGPMKVGAIECVRFQSTRGFMMLPIMTEDILVTKEGVYRHAQHNLPIEPPFQFIKLPPKAGSTFTVDSKIQMQSVKGTFTVEMGDVKVGKETYNNCMIVKTDNLEVGALNMPSVKIKTTTWYAEKVGMVKQVVSLGDREVVFELERYTEGKPPAP